MMNVFEALRASHDRQRSLARSLVGVNRTAEEREALFHELKVELAAHAAAEERFLYVPLLMTDRGLSVARHAMAEHHEIDELVDQLSVQNKKAPTWLLKAKKLSKAIHHHLKEEEKAFFQMAGQVLGDREKTTFAKKVIQEHARMREVFASA
jgi:hypothetical protein